MRIVSAKVTPIAFRDPPLLNAAGIHEPYALRSIIEIETDTGLVGLGESYGEAAALATLTAAAPRLVGLDPYDLNGLLAVAADTVAHMPAPAEGAELAPGSHPSRQAAICRSAFEVALLDLQAKHAGVPLHAVLGGAVRRRVPFSAYLFFKYARHIEPEEAVEEWGEALTPEQIVGQARRMIARHGFASIKLKAGALHPDIEVATVEALAEAFPGMPLRIDPNGAWSMDTAVRCAQRLGPLVEYYEDPVDGIEAMAQLRRQTGLELATNMVVMNFGELSRNLEIGAVQVILADHHYWGGLRDSQQLAAMCRTFALGLSMHSNSHLGISLMAMAHLAATTPNLNFDCDTHYPWVEETDEVLAGGKVPIEDGCVTLSDEPGLGVTLDQQRLARQNTTFERIAIRKRDDEGQMRKYDPSFSARKPRF